MNTSVTLVALYTAPFVVLLAAVLMAWRNHVIMRNAHKQNGFDDSAKSTRG